MLGDASGVISCLIVAYPECGHLHAIYINYSAKVLKMQITVFCQPLVVS